VVGVTAVPLATFARPETPIQADPSGKRMVVEIPGMPSFTRTRSSVPCSRASSAARAALVDGGSDGLADDPGRLADGAPETIGDARAASDGNGAVAAGFDAAGPAPAGDPVMPSQPTASSTAPARVASRIPERRERRNGPPLPRVTDGRVTGRAMLMRRYRGRLTRRLLLEVTMLRSLQRDGCVAWNHDRRPDGHVHEIIGPDRRRA